MSLIHSPRIVTDGLKLVLDAGVPTSWNAGISTNWTDKVGGNNGTLSGGTYHNDGPFVGAGYVEFDGSGDRLSASSSDFSLDGDFTVEYWIQSQNNTGNSGYVLHFGGGNISYFGTKSGSYVLQANNNGEHFWTGVPTINTWVHLALVRSGSTVTLYEDGISLGNKTESQTFGNSTFVIADWDGQFPVTGYISNFRILKGTALYTSNFTPPTKPLTAVTNTKLLTCQGNTITDASSSAHSISVTGNAAANLGYPASAFVFDGTDDNCSLGPSSDFTPGTGAFTIEMWIYPTATPSQYEGPAYYTGSGVNNTSLFWAYRSGYLDLVNNGDSYTLLRMTYPTLNQWVHLVASRDASGYFAVYENGVVKASTTSNSDNYEQTEIYIGGSGLYRWPGKVSIFKMHKGKGLTAAEVEQNYNALKRRYA